jgi:SSS family solute:Na+ symporter
MMKSVLDLMLYSYAFMVSGLFVPIIGGLYWKRSSSAGAFAAMIIGGGTTVTLELSGYSMPLNLDPNLFGITASALSFVIFSYVWPD